MAQGAVAVMPTLSNGAAQSSEELHEILEYERIVQFKDAVLAGTHPRVKIPPHLNGKHASSVRNLASPALLSTIHLHQPLYSAATPNKDSSSYFISANNQRFAENNQASKLGKSEIDPIFLQKSDDLIKAEMNLQRVRLEKALREQIEDQRRKAKGLLQTSESLPSFDISEVLLKAQALVNPSASAQIEPVLAAGDSQADDSFDENTFYSSQHDSSEWSNSSLGQKEPTEVQSPGLVSAEEPDGRVKSHESRAGGEEQVSSSLLLNTQLPASSQYSQSQILPGLGTNSINSGAIGAGSSSVNTGGQIEGRETRGKKSSQGFATTAQQHIDQNTVQHTTDQLLRQAFEEDRASPVVRAHNLSPLAPQPARVSPLATARAPPILRENILANEAAPAQVTALRTQPTGNSSTASSPKGNKGSEKKKGKKKKRKTKDVRNSPDSPYIKPEPRSPSPYAMAPLPRPQKRQRQSGQYATELNYDDQPRYESTNVVQDRAPERDRFQDARAPAYERIEDRYDQDGRRPEPIYRRIERGEDNYRRVSSDAFSRRPESPYSPAYTTSHARPTGTVSHAIDHRTEEPARYYKEPTRTVLRPDADRERSRSPRRSPLAMGPPRQPVRIVLDEHGREYIDPTPIPAPVSNRQSAVPPTRYREGDVVYERAPMRAASSRAPIEYEEDGVTYRRASPISAVPRRVITQPEYTLDPSADYRSYREREYSVRPGTMASPGDDHPPARVVERRPIPQYDGDPPREYLPRGEPVRDEPPRGYLSRAPVREEAFEFAPRATSVRPDVVRYESRPDPSREYLRAPSVRPADPVRYESRGEPMREFDPRAMSIRPEVRYEVPRQYPSRLQSVRPEAPPREYASSVRPEGRREMIARPPGEYNVRPMEPSGLREQVMAPPAAERYYEDAARGRPAEIAYIERPRAREASVVVYSDDTRREVYR